MTPTNEAASKEPRLLGALERELKFTMSDRCAPEALSWMRLVCDPDPSFPRGIVTSIYYDTPDCRYLAEKLNSDYLKTKIRLRWYQDPDEPASDGPAFLEAKYRIGARREKLHLAMPFRGSEAAAWPLTDARLAVLPRRIREEGYPVEPGVTPFLTIRYKRHRFIDRQSGYRVSLDTDISVPAVNPMVLRPALRLTLPVAVAEVKGDFNDLPPSLLGLIERGARRASFSKLWACYQSMLRVAV